MDFQKHVANLSKLQTKLDSTVFVRFLCTLMEKIGAFNLHEGSSKQKRNQKLYVVAVLVFYISVCCFHLLSTVVRSTQYLPQCFQAVYEDVSIICTILAVIYFRVNYDKLDSLVIFMETSFSKANEDVTRRCLHDSRRLFMIVYSLLLCSGLGAIVEALIPLSAKDLAIERTVYQTKHPHRRQPLRILIPYVDESESPAYVIIFIVEVYFAFLGVSMFAIIITAIPVILLYLKGQYEILSKYVEKIGVVHVDEAGRLIVYTNIESNSYKHVEEKTKDVEKEAEHDENERAHNLIKTTRLESQQPNLPRNVSQLNSEKVEKESNKTHCLTIKMEQKKLHQSSTKETDYEQEYVKQIVRFHQKLLFFQDELLDLLSPIALGVILGNTLALSLCIYEVMVFSPTVRLYVQLVSVAVEYFFLCNMSELADDYHTSVRRALINSAWHKVSARTKRDLCVLLRRVQRPNHLTFHKGAVVISNAFFLQVVRTSYNFVNFMRLRLNVRRG